MNEKFKEDFEYFKELINNKEFDKTLKKYSWLNFTINSMFLLFLLAIYDLYQKNNNMFEKQTKEIRRAYIL